MSVVSVVKGQGKVSVAEDSNMLLVIMYGCNGGLFWLPQWVECSGVGATLGLSLPSHEFDVGGRWSCMYNNS